MSEVDGFILIGGASSRMGADKARLRLGGQSFVERIGQALSAITDRVSVVGAQEDAAHWNLPNVPDLIPRWGALGGIHAALKASRADWAAIVACDLPFVTRELFSRLSPLRQKPDAAVPAQFDAVVPVQTDGRPQPLCALYRRQLCLMKTEELIAAGERRPRALLAAVATRWVNPGELADLPAAEHFFFNVNTPEDYGRAKEIVSRDLVDAS